MLRLRTKLTLALLGLALVPLVVTTLVVTRVTTEALERASRDYRVATADYARNLVQQLLERVETELITIGASLAQPNVPREERERQARAHLLGSRYVDRVAVFGPTGQHVFTLAAGDKKPATLTRPDQLEEGLRAVARREGLATLRTGPTSDGKFLLPVLAPTYTGVGKARRVYAYLWATVPVAVLDAQLGELSRRRFGRQANRVFVVDHQLRVVAHADRSRRGLSIAQRGLLADLPPGQAPRQDIAYAAQYTHGGEELLGILVPLARPSWSVVVEQRSSEVFQAVRSTWQTALFVGIGLLLFAVVVGVLMGGRLAGPVSAVASAARTVAGGDFSPRVTTHGNDEVAGLGRAFNQMASDLGDFRAKLVEETRIRADLGRFLSAEVVETIVASGGKLALGGERREVTVLFADVVAFTPLAEKHAPEHVVAILNELFSFLTEIVFKHGGTVDKFIGDCVMAVFGAPYQHHDDPLRAVRAAEEMMRWLETGNTKWRKDLGRELALGIGIHTGEAVAGNIGSEKRMEYTVIGDTVNIAARLEALAQPGQVLLTKTTSDRVADEFDSTSLGMHRVVGREQEIEIFALDE